MMAGAPLTLYRNGSVYSASDPFATAILVDGETVAWVGSEQAATSIQDARMEVIDLAGALVAPGFVDSHVHLTETGLALSTLDLSAAHDADAVLELVRRAAGTATDGADIILGHGWTGSRWERRPTAAELDRASGGRRVYLASADLHSSLVSGTLAGQLQLAALEGWDAGGYLRGAAHAAAFRASRAFTAQQRAHYQDAALRHAAAAGIVAVAEMGTSRLGPKEDLLGLLDQDAHPGAPRPQVLAYLDQAAVSGQELQEVLADFGGRLRGLTGDVDGSLDAAAPLVARLELATRAGVRLALGVGADGALDLALAALAQVADRLGAVAVRAGGHRFEHVLTADATAIEALGRYGVTASLQPGLAAAGGGPDSGSGADSGPGIQDARPLHPAGSLLAAGVPVCLGSGSPVLPMDPWGAIRACTAHADPAERISARAAFIAHTRAGWRAAGEQNPMLGQLAPGTPASFAVWEVEELMVQAPDSRVTRWSTDPRAGTPLLPALDTPVAPRCLQTVHYGRRLYTADGFGGPGD